MSAEGQPEQPTNTRLPALHPERATETGIMCYDMYKNGERNATRIIEELEKKGVRGYNRNLVAFEIMEMARNVYEESDLHIEFEEKE